MKHEKPQPTWQEKVLHELRRHAALIVFILFIMLVGGGYIAGYRPGPDLTFVKVGTLSVDHIPVGTNIYADLASRGAAKSASQSITLVPGNHSIIVGAPGMQPWEEVIAITSNATTHVEPILVSKQPEKGNVFGPGVARLIAAAATSTPPTITSPLILGCQDIYVSDNRVIAAPLASSTADCAPPAYLCSGGSCDATVVYAPGDTISSVIPFPGHTDGIVVGVGPWVYVLGVNPATPQYFAPLAKGLTPVVLPSATSSVYVVDQGTAYAFDF